MRGTDLVSEPPRDARRPWLDVWYVGVDQVPESLAAFLDARDRARRRQIPGEADQNHYLAAWVLARLVLGERLGRDPATLSFDRSCTHCGDERHGKPVVESAGPSLDFSISHAGGLAVVAVSDRAVGVDVEDATAGEQPLASGLTEGERATCLSYLDFARLWARKEAVLKAIGTGLAVHPRRIEIIGSTLLSLPEDLGRPEDYTLWDLPLPAPYVGSLAVLGTGPSPSARSGAELVGAAVQAVRLCVSTSRGYPLA